MTLVALQDLEEQAREQVAWMTLTVGREHSPAWMPDLEARQPHAVEFWCRIGYRIVGVVPDAEGIGKPSICLARRL